MGNACQMVHVQCGSVGVHPGATQQAFIWVMDVLATTEACDHVVRGCQYRVRGQSVRHQPPRTHSKWGVPCALEDPPILAHCQGLGSRRNWRCVATLKAPLSS